MKTRNGKIARLPRALREELNRRMEDGECGKKLVEWLNAQPEAQRVLAAEFCGREVTEQNLSQWRQGGFQDWQKQQERCDWVRRLTEEAANLETEAGELPISERWSAVLFVELAQAAREVLDAATEPEARWQRMQEIIGKFAQMRRVEANAARMLVVKEQWERKKAKQEESKRAMGAWMPRQALMLQELCVSGFERIGMANQNLNGGEASDVAQSR